jgi:Lrp/AsnC family leucine-responsive transcriptional regulator
MATKYRRRRPVAFHNTSALLDANNLALLAHLAAEPRIPMRELARRVDMSAPAVTERVLRLRDMGVIRGEQLDIDQRALGLSVTAYVRVRPIPGALPRIIELAQHTPEVVECHRVTGDDCFIMKVVAADIGELESLLDEFLTYGNTTSSLVVSSPVPLRTPPLPSAAP